MIGEEMWDNLLKNRCDRFNMVRASRFKYSLRAYGGTVKISGAFVIIGDWFKIEKKGGICND
ncbi:MAG: hypothetical protein Hyperionvirus16_49 [Hyperionvirus sp.]|uniref:Uncharacterized protein n=1 Tax=Hyperionvirus sp. TaxID=2487770 RepID=A0A3G5ABW3_9VIRU|nr:MAG: hypothetical protein Hyperionvirus16_49 [Hyperionvirus sp.]